MKFKMCSIPFFAVLLSLAACTRTAGDNSTVNQVATSGTWRVTLFSDSGNDETADFNGYSFAFNDNGSLSAIRNGSTQNGTWSVSNGSSKFNINLGPKDNSNKPLGELTNDWKILSTTSTEIRLTDDNSASNEFLTFSKN